MSNRKLLTTFISLLILACGGYVVSNKVPTSDRTVASSNFAAGSQLPVNAPFSLAVEPDAGQSGLITEIKNAQKSVDMIMYELSDQTVEQALVDDTSRGVQVRVLLNGGYYGKPDNPNKNQAAYDFLSSHGISVRWTPGYFALTHEKSLVIDGKEGIIMTGNLTPQYYASGRDFYLFDRDQTDISAMEQVFTKDWNDMKDVANQNDTADDLLWSPNSRDELVALIDNAHSSLSVYNEEMNDTGIEQALIAAAGRGVKVEVLMTDSKSWHKAFDELAASGVEIRIYPARAPLYIHAKMILADNNQLFLGSENFSPTSLDKNRELGIVTSDTSLIAQLSQVFAKDWSGGAVWH